MQNIDVSIIIVNFKTSELVFDCLRSINNFTNGIAFEVIVVDNSEDEKEFSKLLALRSSFSFSIKILKPQKNLGFGTANNLGAKESKGTYVLFLNSDTVLLNNAIKQMIDTERRTINVGILGANLFQGNGKPSYSYSPYKISQRMPIKMVSIFAWAHSKIRHRNPFFNYSNHPLAVKGYITGACMLIKKDLFFKIGPFDERIFMYSEDLLLSYRFQKAGYKLINDPAAKIIHYEGGSSTKEISDTKAGFMADGAAIFAGEAFGLTRRFQYLKTLARSESILAFRSKIRHKILEYKNCMKLRKYYLKKSSILKVVK